MLKKNIIYPSLLLVVMLAFVINKIPYLNLPYYWDEAWPYGPAVWTMLNNGISLLPGSIDPDLSRGHPLLFHFLAALWMNIFEPSVFVSHLFALFVSLMVLLLTYQFGSKYFSPEAGLLASILLCFQQTFNAQSVLLLPEMMVALFTLCSLYFYLNNKHFLYIVSTTMLCLTKESGIVIFPTLMVCLLFRKYPFKSIKVASLLKQAAFILIPLLLASFFFIAQKNISGWYFSPVNTNEINFDVTRILNKLENYFSSLFIYQYRNIISIVVIFSIFFYYKFKKEDDRKNDVIVPLAIFILIFLLFSSLCFYSPRYLLCCYPLFMLLASHFIISNKKQVKYTFPALLLMLVLQINYFFIKEHNDHHVSYADDVKSNLEMVRFCEKENLFERKIFAKFIMGMSLSNRYSGYLSNKSFNAIVPNFSEDVAFCIFSRFENDEHNEMRQSKNLKLLKRFEVNEAWTEIYVHHSP